jgi:hypothetical protein
LPELYRCMHKTRDSPPPCPSSSPSSPPAAQSPAPASERPSGGSATRPFAGSWWSGWRPGRRPPPWLTDCRPPREKLPGWGMELLRSQRDADSMRSVDTALASVGDAEGEDRAARQEEPQDLSIRQEDLLAAGPCGEQPAGYEGPEDVMSSLPSFTSPKKMMLLREAAWEREGLARRGEQASDPARPPGISRGKWSQKEVVPEICKFASVQVTARWRGVSTVGSSREAARTAGALLRCVDTNVHGLYCALQCNTLHCFLQRG